VLEENVNHKEGDNLTWSYLLQKFTIPDGKKMWMTLSGSKYYGLQFMPIYLTTHPVQRLEAEDAALQGVAVAKDKEGYTGRGYVSGFDNTGDQCAFRVSVEKRGAYLMKIRYNTREYRHVDLIVNGKLVEKLKLGKSEQVYAKWTEMSLFAWLQRGENLISFRADDSGMSQGLSLDSLSVALYSEEPQSSSDWVSTSVPRAISRP
jgi:hypothetical protein